MAGKTVRYCAGAAGLLAAVAGVACEDILGLKPAELYKADGGTSASATASTTTTSSSTSGTAGSGGGGGGGTGGAGGGPVGDEVWGEGFQDTIGDPFQPALTGIAVDKLGNTFVTGSYKGTITFAPGAGGSFSSVGSGSYFLASFDATGMYRWGVSYNAIGNQGVSVWSSVAVDASGNVMWAADLSKPSVKVGPNTYNNPSGSFDAVLVASFDTNGLFRWARVYGGANAAAYPTAVGVTSENDVIVTGSYDGPITFGALPPVTPSGMFVAKLEGKMGSPQWSYGYGDVPNQPSGSQVPYGMAIDSGDAIVVTGRFDTSIQLAATALFSAGGSDIFVAKLSSVGDTVTWSARYGSPKNDFGTAVAVDPGGGVLLFGVLGGPADFGAGNVMVPAMGAALDGFVAKYDGTAAKTLKWAKTFGGMSGVTVNQCGVVSDANSNVVLAGATVGPVNLGGSVLMPAGANPNVYLAKLGATGEHDWSKMFGDMNGQVSPVVATDPTTQEIVIAFSNNGTVNLGKNMVTSNPTASSLVLARFHP